MGSVLTIGRVEKQVGLPAKTIRFYENIGLIAPAKRLENGYRVYNLRQAEELRLIKYARDLGLPIAEIKKLMKGCDAGTCTHTKQYLESEIASYTRLLDEKIAQLTTLKQKLGALRGTIASKDYKEKTAYCCNILQQLVERR